MDRRKRIMGLMVAGLDKDIGWIKMIQLEVEDIWIKLIGGLTLMDFILVHVLRDIKVITTNILIGGVSSSILQRSSMS